MKLYYDLITVNCRKVVAAFALMDIGFEKSHVDYLGGGHKSRDYLEINPCGTLPTLVDGDFTLWESNAILQYAAEKAAAFAFYPREINKRADIQRWLFWEAAHWYPSCYVYLVENLMKPMMNSDPDRAALDKEEPNWRRLANILERRLTDRAWICGDCVTLADIAVAAPLHLYPYMGLPLDSYPNIRRWMSERVDELPCWKATDVALMLGLKVA